MALITHILVGPAGLCVRCGITLAEIQQLNALCPGYIVVCHPRPHFMKMLGGSERERKKARVVFSLLGS